MVSVIPQRDPVSIAHDTGGLSQMGTVKAQQGGRALALLWRRQDADCFIKRATDTSFPSTLQCILFTVASSHSHLPNVGKLRTILHGTSGRGDAAPARF